MTEIYGAPQLPLTGSEFVTIQQMQNGRLALCTMPLSDLAALLSGLPTVLPTALPATPSTYWNNNGVVSITPSAA